MEFEQLIAERYSVRSFRAEQLPPKTLSVRARLGYPSEDAAPLPLHEKTRPLSEVVYYEHF